MDRVLTAIGRVRRDHPRAVDWLIAVGLAIGNVYSVSQDDPSVPYEYTDPDLLLWTCAVVAGLVLAWRQRWPLPVHLVVLVCAAVPTAMGYNAGSLPLSVAFSTYSVAAWSERRVGFAGLAATMTALAVLTAVQAPDFRDGDALGAFVTFGAVWVIGEAQRGRRHRLEEAEARAREVEQRRADEAERAVAAERLRVAQELHDVVAHAMSVVAVQSGAAAHVIDQHPDRAKQALQTIEHTSREALQELRRMLGVLRRDDVGTGLSPAPTLAELESLAERFRSVGVAVSLRRTGSPAGLPPSLELTAYRLVQEALTNVLRHAGPARAEVLVACGPEGVRVTVVDDGLGARVGFTGGTGHGLVGMRERVALFGGTLEAGARRDGPGFRVAATLPFAEAVAPAGAAAP
jgi:signal transduction histidine kinase